jgi:hypothetical protein
MTTFLQLTLWNANGLPLHAELKLFMSIHGIGVMLISGTHFTGMLPKNSQIHSLLDKPSHWNCSRRNRYNNKILHPAPSNKQVKISTLGGCCWILELALECMYVCTLYNNHHTNNSLYTDAPLY